MFAYVKCTCGRTLRAQRSPERVTIQCWECGAEVVVRPYREVGENPIVRVRRVLDTGRLEAFAALVLLALGTVAALLLPRIGLPAGLAVMAGAAILYLGRIEEPGREAEAAAGGPPPPPKPLARLGLEVGRGLLALGFAAGMALPFWLADGSHEVESTRPHLPGWGTLILALAIWLILPVVIYCLTARDGEGRLGARRALATLPRQRWRTLAALLAFPLAVALLEGAIVGAHAAVGRHLEYLAADLLPLPEGTVVRYGAIMKNRVELYESPGGAALYLGGLRRGATLVGAIPMSLPRGLEAKVSPRLFSISSREYYLLARLGLSTGILFVLYATLAWQSRTLGSISEPADEPVGQGETVEEPAPEPALT